MIKEAIEKLQELFEDAHKITEYRINDDIYTERNLRLVTPYVPKRDTMSLNSLNSLVANMFNNTIDEDKVSLPLRVIVQEQEVTVYSDIDINYDRERLFIVKAQNPQLRFNSYMTVEEMIIQLQTGFLEDENENRKNLIQMISYLKKDNSVELADDGVTQIVKLTQGVSSIAEVKVQPLVWLKPIRTFYEVEQPEQMFLIRINTIGDVALFDAGGGRWKYDCQEAIRAYLLEEFNQYVADGTVVIG